MSLPSEAEQRFPETTIGQSQRMLWIPVLITVALLGLVLLIFWSAWEPFRDDLKEDPLLMVPLVTLLGATVLLPPFAWAIALVN
jgi:hypothetical protein